MIEATTPPKKKTLTLEKVTKALIIPVVVAGIGAWMDKRSENRTQTEKLRTDSGWETLVPVIKEMQATIKAEKERTDLLRDLVLVLKEQRRERRPATVVPTIETNPALDAYSNKLVVKVQQSQIAPMVQKKLPEHLDDVPTKK